MDAAALLAGFPLVRVGWPHWRRGGVLYELAHTPSYPGDPVIRATLPAGRGLELVQGTQGWPLAGSTDEQVGLDAWLAYRAPDVAAAVGPVWAAETMYRAGAASLDREMNLVFSSYLAMDGYDFAVTRDRNARSVYFVPHATPVDTLYFHAADVLERSGGRVRWRPEAGFLHAVEPPPAPAAWGWGGGTPVPAPAGRDAPFLRTVTGVPHPPFPRGTLF